MGGGRSGQDSFDGASRGYGGGPDQFDNSASGIQS